MAFDCDILVIGAGPAGSSAALAAAREGVSVLLVERGQTVGVPVRCAEYIPKALLGELPFSDRSFVVQQVDSMRTILPDGATHQTKAPGLMIQRDRFDRLLAESAIEEGVELLLGTRFLEPKDGFVVLKGPDGSFFRIRAKVIIGADGPRSSVGRWIGSPVKRLIPAIQVKGLLTAPMDHTEIYFNPKIYGGYAWVFPKGGEANVGLAVVRGSKWSIPLKSALEWFLDVLRSNGIIKGEPHSLIVGWIPAEPVTTSVKRNMILVGDAAGQTHPITGAGVPQAVMCGRLAGYWAARAVIEDNLNLLNRYDREWREDYGDSLEWACERRELLEANWERLADILPKCWVAFREYYGRS